MHVPRSLRDGPCSCENLISQLNIVRDPAIKMLTALSHKPVSVVAISNELSNTSIAAAQRSDPVLDTVFQHDEI